MRDLGSIPWSVRSPGEGNGNAQPYSCLENSMDREAWPLQSMGSQRVRYNWETNTSFLTLTFKKYLINIAGRNIGYAREIKLKWPSRVLLSWKEVSICFFINYLFYFTTLYRFCHTLTWICHECTIIIQWLQYFGILKRSKGRSES